MHLQEVTGCEIDADGVEAEWIEATVAYVGQPTVILVFDPVSHPGSAEQARHIAGDLAVATGARVLIVAAPTITAAVSAYAWLLAEGVDLSTARFATEPWNPNQLGTILHRARAQGLPTPRTGTDLTEPGSGLRDIPRDPSGRLSGGDVRPAGSSSPSACGLANP
jgi:hypothetical protein